MAKRARLAKHNAELLCEIPCWCYDQCSGVAGVWWWCPSSEERVGKSDSGAGGGVDLWTGPASRHLPCSSYHSAADSPPAFRSLASLREQTDTLLGHWPAHLWVLSIIMKSDTNYHEQSHYYSTKVGLQYRPIGFIIKLSCSSWETPRRWESCGGSSVSATPSWSWWCSFR